jgi:hypothetical protein
MYLRNVVFFLSVAVVSSQNSEQVLCQKFALKKCKTGTLTCKVDLACLGKLVKSLYCVKCKKTDNACLSSHAKMLCASENPQLMAPQTVDITLAPTAAPSIDSLSKAPTTAPSFIPTQHPTTSPTPVSSLQIKGAISLEGYAMLRWSPMDKQRVSAAIGETVGIDAKQVGIMPVRQVMNNYWGGLLLEYKLYIPQSFCDEQGACFCYASHYKKLWAKWLTSTHYQSALSRNLHKHGALTGDSSSPNRGMILGGGGKGAGGGDGGDGDGDGGGDLGGSDERRIIPDLSLVGGRSGACEKKTKDHSSSGSVSTSTHAANHLRHHSSQVAVAVAGKATDSNSAMLGWGAAAPTPSPAAVARARQQVLKQRQQQQLAKLARLEGQDYKPLPPPTGDGLGLLILILFLSVFGVAWLVAVLTWLAVKDWCEFTRQALTVSFNAWRNGEMNTNETRKEEGGADSADSADGGTSGAGNRSGRSGTGGGYGTTGGGADAGFQGGGHGAAHTDEADENKSGSDGGDDGEPSSITSRSGAGGAGGPASDEEQRKEARKEQYLAVLTKGNNGLVSCAAPRSEGTEDRTEDGSDEKGLTKEGMLLEDEI